MIVPKIIALDPARRAFYPVSESFGAISKSDAEFVQVIHTNGGDLGVRRITGTVDFYPNGGELQPGCDQGYISKILKENRNPCSHSRAWQMYQESIINPQGFPAISCASYDDFLENNNCSESQITYMGFATPANTWGKYYLQTNGNQYHLSRGTLGLIDHPTNFTYPFGKPI